MGGGSSSSRARLAFPLNGGPVAADGKGIRRETPVHSTADRGRLTRQARDGPTRSGTERRAWLGGYSVPTAMAIVCTARAPSTGSDFSESLDRAVRAIRQAEWICRSGDSQGQWWPCQAAFITTATLKAPARSMQTRPCPGQLGHAGRDHARRRTRQLNGSARLVHFSRSASLGSRGVPGWMIWAGQRSAAVTTSLNDPARGSLTKARLSSS